MRLEEIWAALVLILLSFLAYVGYKILPPPPVPDVTRAEVKEALSERDKAIQALLDKVNQLEVSKNEPPVKDPQ